MNAQEFEELLFKLEACEEGREFCEGKSLKEFWETCERGDWMLWLYARASNYNLSIMSFTKGHCANTVRNLMDDQRSINAVDAAIAFGEGNISEEELSVAAAAAHSSYSATVAAAAAAAFSAAAAASAAAAYYSAAASAAAAAYSYSAAYSFNQKQTAEICRKYLPLPIFN